VRILTILEAAELLHIHRDTAYRYVREGKSPAVKVGRNWRVLQEVLEEWLRERSGRTVEGRPETKPRKMEEPEIREALTADAHFEHAGLGFERVP